MVLVQALLVSTQKNLRVRWWRQSQANFTVVIGMLVFMLWTIAAIQLAEATGQIAFTFFRNGTEEIYVIQADGSNQTRLAFGSRIAWSPTGDRIAFSSYRDLFAGIYVMRADGSNQTYLASGDSPTWSPAGDQIAYDSDNIYVMQADGSNQTRLTFDGDGDSIGPIWSPAGDQIAYQSRVPNSSHDEVYVIRADGSNQTRLTFSGTISASHYSWSPTGDRIAFARPPSLSDPKEIYVVNVNGSNQTRLTFSLYSDMPAWSPTGDQIAFVSRPGQGSSEIYVMKSDGTNMTQLTFNSMAHNDLPVWSPTGDQIAFVCNRGDLCVMRADGSNQTRLTSIGSTYEHVMELAWRPCPHDKDCDGIQDDIDGILLDGIFRDQDSTGQQTNDIPSFSFSDARPSSGGRTSGVVFDSQWAAPTHRFFHQQADIGNFGVGRRLQGSSDTLGVQGGNDIDSIIVHYCVGNFHACRNEFATPPILDPNGPSTYTKPPKSAHYVVSTHGDVVSMVVEANRAIHATYYNDRSIGIEVEGSGIFKNQTYESLANLIARILITHPNIQAQVDAYSQLGVVLPLHPPEPVFVAPFHIEIGSNGKPFHKIDDCLDIPGILGHQQVQSGKGTPPCRADDVAWKSDPGPHFEWPNFMNRVTQRLDELSRAPKVTVTDASNPSEGVKLEAAGGNGGTAYVVPTCQSPSSTPIPVVDGVIRLQNGNSAILTCGSLIVKVISGPIDILLSRDIVVTVPTATEVQLEDIGSGRIVVENVVRSAGTISIHGNGQTWHLAPGNTQMITPTDQNQTPVADAGPNQVVRVGSLVTLDGSHSFDPNGREVSYGWAQTLGPLVDFNGDTTPAPDFIPSVAGVYEFSLVVTDGLAMSMPATVQVTVTQLPSDSDGDGVPDDQDTCLNSNISATIIVDVCNSGVANHQLGAGCTINDKIALCAKDVRNHGQFVSCVAHLTNGLKKNGTISNSDKGKIQSCAGQANIP